MRDKRLTWAMTQLGATYARPVEKAPDFSLARSLWSIAAAQGDPVAMCFLARMHEKGLATPVDTVAALALYEKAHALGGCKDSSAAIARLKR